MLNFDFLEKGMGIVSSPHFVHHFSKKMFLILYFINWTNFIVWLLLLFEVFGNMCIAIVCSPDCDTINFQINLCFKSSRFSTWPKIQDKNLNIFRRKRYSKMKSKAFFIIFKGLSVAKICLRIETLLSFNYLNKPFISFLKHCISF